MALAVHHFHIRISAQFGESCRRFNRPKQVGIELAKERTAGNIHARSRQRETLGLKSALPLATSASLATHVPKVPA
jgi:hypothetical protein